MGCISSGCIAVPSVKLWCRHCADIVTSVVGAWRFGAAHQLGAPAGLAAPDPRNQRLPDLVLRAIPSATGCAAWQTCTGRARQCSALRRHWRLPSVFCLPQQTLCCVGGRGLCPDTGHGAVEPAVRHGQCLQQWAHGWRGGTGCRTGPGVYHQSGAAGLPKGKLSTGCSAHCARRLCGAGGCCAGRRHGRAGADPHWRA